MPDHHDLAPGGAQFCDFDVNLGHQGARGIEHAQPPLLCVALHYLRYAVRREHHDAACRHLIELVDKHGALGAQIVDHILVVHDFMPNVNRCAMHRERPLDDFDRAVNAGTKTTRLREDNFHRFSAVGGQTSRYDHSLPLATSLVEVSSVAIKDWPEGERPRERLLASGARALSDAELLAVFLRTGTPGRSAIDLGRDALARFGGLNGLFAADASALAEVGGFGPAKYTQLQAVLELARRALQEDVKRDTLLSSPGKVRDYLRLILARLEHEVFVALYMDSQNKLIATDELFRGTLTQTSVYPREVVKRALKHNAAGVIFAHNHPSGVAEPSRADELLTANLKQALSLVDVKVLDHLIVAGSATVSFAERGLL